MPQGSPPPMRGKGGKKHLLKWCTGITPAYAGKRIQYQAGAMGLKDHPRLCGEKCPIYPPLMTKIGSPPPMRGKEFLSLDCL